MKILLIEDEEHKSNNHIELLVDSKPYELIESHCDIKHVLNLIKKHHPDMIYINIPDKSPLIYLTGINTLDELKMANKFNVKSSKLEYCYITGDPITEHCESPCFYHNLIDAIDNNIRIIRLEKLITHTLE